MNVRRSYEWFVIQLLGGAGLDSTHSRLRELVNWLGMVSGHVRSSLVITLTEARDAEDVALRARLCGGNAIECLKARGGDDGRARCGNSVREDLAAVFKSGHGLRREDPRERAEGVREAVCVIEISRLF